MGVAVPGPLTTDRAQQALARTLHDELGELFYSLRLELGAAIGVVRRAPDPQLREIVDRLQVAAGLTDLGAKALARGPYIPSELPHAAPAARRVPPHDALSDREYQVLRMIGAGRTVSDIAVALALSVKTVSTYRARVLEKLQLRTSAELIHYAIVNKLNS